MGNNKLDIEFEMWVRVEEDDLLKIVSEAFRKSDQEDIHKWLADHIEEVKTRLRDSVEASVGESVVDMAETIIDDVATEEEEN